ncbi:MAG: glutamine-hydrolyzing carbamoyl-phosphate synthase small subunit [Euryarchaeota archaeon]|nr:glutamine-hydrolyzing carbamoyl-phosphate synthase small subunit [Euryarchaeota archaeon]MBU4223419.1 glutamine-hydrolyzing carbamoyl-phosphate synthase small subunit [Euryarchaeota archaeon]MBU4339751.1 glutamine-hydrolyzing carbamoyl-phosphate synthase small subunit [Euryarchaeota archaeon]MBU4454490.1 glutamine-hydrolyzing carbamoyl-phosphate synthase small subunit [Euryarchaeota archaeon]
MKAVLGLEDGTFVKGEGLGVEGIVQGELVFTTQYTGYEEALTDPSYKGQILMFTYPLIGNYGVSGDNFQSDGMKAEGLVVREACDHPSHHRSTRSIYEFLKDEGKSGIMGIDTRMLTIKTREHGTMKAAIIVGDDDGEKAVRLAREQTDIGSIDLISKVTCREPYRIEGKEDGGNIVLMDFGAKRNIIKSLASRGINVTVVPATTSVKDIMNYEPDAILLSNGPGDPQQATNGISVVKRLAGELPIFGICLGHQIISLGLGGETYKMKFGHRGANQPVKDLKKGIVHITSQNHGYAVDENSLDKKEVSVTQLNTNDGTVEGLEHKDLEIMCVQYHPEAHPGPLDTEKLFFDRVAERVRKMKVAAR